MHTISGYLRMRIQPMTHTCTHLETSLLICLLFFLSITMAPAQIETPLDQTALYQYVHEEDPNFSFEHIRSADEEGYSYHILRVQSQKWLTTEEVEDPLWWHWVTIVVPDEIRNDVGFVWISGGDREDNSPKNADQLIVQTALLSGSVTIKVHNIPNQPTNFKNDDFGPRDEDELISYGWKKFLDGGSKDEDVEWLARFPMTKGVVRCVDAAFAYLKESQNLQIDQFTVGGASKRGWTTWATAMADPRVVAIVPVVIDLLNGIPSLEHHYKAYGFWAPAINDYVREEVMYQQRTPEYAKLLQHVEPYHYKEQLTMPKMIINASSDQFFLPDSWQFYYDSLQGEKHLRYIANIGHSLRGTDALHTLIAFHTMVANKVDRPNFQWKVTDDQFHISTPTSKPDSLILWTAINKEARDFRFGTIGKSWKRSIIPIEEDGEYNIPLPTVKEGWAASFVELVFNVGAGVNFKESTGIVVTPKALPFENCEQDKIIELVDHYAAAREASDPEALRAILTYDADQLVSSGVWRNTRDNLVKGMVQSSAANPGKRTLKVQRVRFLGKDVALADARYSIEQSDGTVRNMWSTFVARWEDQRWKIAAIRNMKPAE